MQTIFKSLFVPMILMTTTQCTRPQLAHKHTFIEAHGTRSMAKAQSVRSTITQQVIDGNTMSFTGTVSSDEYTPKGLILWKTPETAKVIYGAVQSTFDEKNRTFEIRVRNLKDGDKVVFLPYTMAGNEKRGAPALFIVGQPERKTPDATFQKSNRFGKKRKIYQ